MSSLPTVIQCPSPVLHPGAQGIARVTVNDAAAQLIVTFLAPITSQELPYILNPLSYSLTGGERLFPRVLTAAIYPASSPPPQNPVSVLLTLDQIGDFSIYTLTVSGTDIDPFFSSVTLRFRLACETSFDCRQMSSVPAPPSELPVNIDYLAKDYAGFRQALLDFIPTRLPEWTERSEADMGMMLLELFCATADNLSYTQDRIANEAFLPTATQRRSVAAHLALLGYQMDEGASALTWLQFQVNAVQSLSGNPGFQVSNSPGVSADPVIVFETLGPVRLDPAHNQITLFNFGNSNCCLPGASLSAMLTGSFPALQMGDYLLFDSGPGMRDVVRLNASPQIIPAPQIGSPSSPPSPPAFVTIVSWSPAMPLHHDYCLTGTSVRGNVAPATRGETVSETLRSLTGSQKAQLQAAIAARPASQRVPRQRLMLANAPLAHLDAAVAALGLPLPSDPPVPPEVTDRSPRAAGTLQLQVDGVAWHEQTSLLNSQPHDLVFRVEIDDQGQGVVVFGDNIFGLRPAETSTVTATYRVGGGARGNVGADTLVLAHPPAPATWLNSVTNPLAATGGRDPEPGSHARLTAPATFHQPLVTVTAADYQDAAMAFTDENGRPLIQRANAGFRWTGSWLTVTLVVDPIGAEVLTPDLRQSLLDYFAAKRLSGYDLEIIPPSFISVDLQIQFLANSGSQPADVQQSLLQAFSSQTLAGGALGFFHPDNFSFGDRLFVSRIYSAAMAVQGVETARIVRLARSRATQPAAETSANLAQGFLSVHDDQVIRLDNDPNFPENGTLRIIPLGVAS